MIEFQIFTLHKLGEIKSIVVCLMIDFLSWVGNGITNKRTTLFFLHGTRVLTLVFTEKTKGPSRDDLFFKKKDSFKKKSQKKEYINFFSNL